MSEQAMTNAEMTRLEKLVKQRARVERKKAKAHGEQLIANADDELGRRFDLEDVATAEVAKEAEAAVAKVQADMDARLDAAGVRKELRPQIRVNYWPGGYRDKEHRSELRREARVNVNAAVAARMTQIEDWELGALTELARSGLRSEQAHALLDALPAAEEVLPSTEGLLGPVETQPLAVLGSAREQKHAAILAELERDPSRSDRQIGRALGVDGKTVAARRAELRAEDAETREESAELRTEAGGAR